MSVDARAVAFHVRRDWVKVQDGPLDLIDLLSQLEINLSFDEPPGLAEGMSLDVGDSEVIFAPLGPNERRWRFTVAHELGHLLLGHGSKACTGSDLFGSSSSIQEREANVFAAHLLIPSRPLRKLVKRVRPRFAELQPLTDHFLASMTMFALRYMDESIDDCALLGFKSGFEKPWLKKTDSLKWFVEKDAPRGSLVAAWLGDQTTETTQDTDAAVWLRGFDWKGEWTIREEVFKVWDDEYLVLLSEIPDRDDDPDLVEREIDQELERRRNRFSRY